MSIYGKGIKPNTVHLLRGRHSDDMKEFEWTGKAWSSPGTGWGTKPSAMLVLGWQYDSPKNTNQD